MVDVQELLRLDGELIGFVEDVFSSLRRKGWQERSHCYLTGLMLEGRRKSVEPMAARLGESSDQSLQHFLANTPWDPVPVRARLARKMHKAINPDRVGGRRHRLLQGRPVVAVCGPAVHRHRREDHELSGRDHPAPGQ